MSSTAFTRRTFVWLHQVNQNTNLEPTDLKVALQLTIFFNEGDNGGRAYPGGKTIGEGNGENIAGIGLSERTVLRSIKRLQQQGHLKVVWGSRGKKHPNQYWMAIKPADDAQEAAATPAVICANPNCRNELRGQRADARFCSDRCRAQASRTDKTGVSAPVLTATDRTDKTGVRTLKTGAAAPENHLEPPDASHLGERDAEPAAGGHEAAASAAGKKVAAEGFNSLAAAWSVRGHADHVGAARTAFAAAIRNGATADDIAARADVWIAEYQQRGQPNMLPELSGWLAGERWKHPPPPAYKKHLNGHGGRRRKAGVGGGAADTGDRVIDYVMRRKAARKAREAQS